MSRCSLLSLLACLAACGQEPPPPKAPAREVAGPATTDPLDAAPPVADAHQTSPQGHVVLFSDKRHGLYEPFLCCHAGVCRNDGCEEALYDGAELALPTGEKTAVHHRERIDCDTPSGARAVYAGNDLASRVFTRSVWPAERAAELREPDSYSSLNVLDLTKAKQLELKRLKIDGSPAAEVDLDEDGVVEHVLLEYGQGVYLLDEDKRLTLLFEADHYVSSLGHMDLNEDHVRDLILEVMTNPPTVVLVDGATRTELLRTPLYCTADAEGEVDHHR